MKLVVLCDNNTYIDNYLFGEPALSFYIENGEDKILFDTGYSNVFLSNAKTMNIDLNEVNKVVLSHGHNDHTNGLKSLKNNLKLYYCEGCFDKKYGDGLNVSAPYSEKEIKDKFDSQKVTKCTEISKNLYILGPIPRTTDFENENTNLKIKVGKNFVQDNMNDDTALVYDSNKGIYIITGCSHSGICNIVSYTKTIFNKKIAMIIGGLHLFNDDEKSQKTIEFLKNENIKELYPCHCTSLIVKSKMMQAELNVKEVGSGLILDI